MKNKPFSVPMGDLLPPIRHFLTNYRFILITLVATVLFTGCGAIIPPETPPELQRYRDTLLGPFDTVTTFITYAEDEATFNQYRDIVFGTLEDFHQLFDIYNEYEGINNLYTINQMAGIAPVEVDTPIIDLLNLSLESHALTTGMHNIALGPVLQIWHQHRTEGIERPDLATVPTMDELRAANEFTDIHHLIINPENRTVFLDSEHMALDVGAIAKGYATGIAMERAQDAGMDAGIISAGGHVVAVGYPPNTERDYWNISIQDPDTTDFFPQAIDTVGTTDVSVSISGAYERFFEVDGVVFGHLINPDTLMPSVMYAQVVIIHPYSWLTDVLSTALFNLDLETGKALAQQVGAEVLWVEPTGDWAYTDGYVAISRELQQRWGRT